MQVPGRVMGRPAVVAGVAGAVVLLLIALVLVLQRRAHEQRLDEAARTAARDVATALAQRNLAGAPLAGTSPPAAQEQYAAITAGLDAKPDVQVGAVERNGDAGTAELRWTWPFGPQKWAYDTRLALVPGATGSRWAARWSPDVVHADLTDGDVLEASRTAPARADVLGRGGRPLVTDAPVVHIGVQPSRTDDPAGLSRTLAGLLDVDAGALEARVRAAAPDAFVPVVTLRRSDYEPLRDRLRPLAGTVFREATLPLAPSRSFARALLGSAGPVTAEIVEHSDGRLVAGDVAGLSGLQRAYDTRLGGTSGVTVQRTGAEGRAELFEVPPVAGQPVRLTLDAQVQQAADDALTAATGGNGNAALVVLDVPSGDVLAIANTPSAGPDRATTGRYAPGSTFKTISTLALLGTGLTPDEVVPCPATSTVDGRAFRNFEGGALGDVAFREAFAQSCNTAFVSLSDRLDPQDLPVAAASLGLGVPWHVGVDVFAGDVPAPGTVVERAATTIGQGRSLASPAAMAQVAATVTRGSWSAPRLVLEPAPDGAAAAPPVDAAQAAAVRALMRSVVVQGTARALADVPGEPVHAKTGTAEHGTESPPRTHAWTIGFQGDLAFAVLVEEGRSGGEVAVPVVEAFLRGL